MKIISTNIVNNRRNALLCSLVVGILYFFLVFSYIPLCDDQFYTFGNWYEASDMYSINNLSDVFRSQCHDYLTVNGRFIIHFLVQSFCSLKGGHVTFFAITALLLASFIYYLPIYVYERPAKNGVLFTLFVAFYFLLIFPEPEESLFGIVAFIANYLWMAIFTLFFFAWIDRISKVSRRFTIQNILIFCIAFVYGSLQESFSIPIAGALFLYSCHKRKEIKSAQLILLVGLCFGTIFCAFSPSTFSRFISYSNSESISGVSKYVLNILCILRAPVFILFVAFNLYVFCRKGKTKFIKFILDNELLYLVIILSFAICLFGAFLGARQLTVCSLCLLLLILKSENTSSISNRWCTSLSVVGSILLLLFYVNFIGLRVKMKAAWMDFEDCFYENPQVVSCASIWNFYRENEFNELARYLCLEKVMAHVATCKINKQTDAYFSKVTGRNVECEVITPDPLNDIVSNCNTRNEVFRSVYKMPKGYYVIKLPSDNAKEHRIVESGLSSFSQWLQKSKYRSGYYHFKTRLSYMQSFKRDGYVYYIDLVTHLKDPVLLTE